MRNKRVAIWHSLADSRHQMWHRYPSQHHVCLKGCLLGPHTYVRSRCPPLQVQRERTVFEEGGLVEVGITELHTCNVQA